MSEGKFEGKKADSDYALALDLVGTLTRAKTEKQAVEEIRDLFARLFAPGKMEYYPAGAGRGNDKAGLLIPTPGDDFAWAASGKGFLLRVGEADTTLGVLEVDDLAFPQYREHYLSLALILVRVCAMAITNARNFQEIQRTAGDLEAANKELEAFSYSVSHDLRAPLRSMEGFSQLLLEDYSDRLDQQGKEYLRWIMDSAELMARLIDDLLKLSRVAREEMHLESVDLSELAGSIVAGLVKRQPERIIELSIAPGLACRGDGHLLGIAVENLLANAWKFTGKTDSPRIEVGRADHQGIPVYFVRDNGAGFDMAYANKLFSPFQRLHKPSDFPGTGIGLATVQRVIQRHGGKIWAMAELGKGATFYFTLGQ